MPARDASKATPRRLLWAEGKLLLAKGKLLWAKGKLHAAKGSCFQHSEIDFNRPAPPLFEGYEWKDTWECLKIWSGHWQNLSKNQHFLYHFLMNTVGNFNKMLFQTQYFLRGMSEMIHGYLSQSGSKMHQKMGCLDILFTQSPRYLRPPPPPYNEPRWGVWVKPGPIYIL